MKRWMGVLLAALVPVSICTFTVGGCGDETTVDDEAVASEADGLWRRRGVPRIPPTPPPPSGGTVDAGSGGAGPGSDVGCEVCTQAKACCEAVNVDTKAVTQFAGQQAGRTARASGY